MHLGVGTAIKVDRVNKYYHVYDRPIHRISQMFSFGRKQFYREFRAINNVSFQIYRGESVAIIGRNGSGKSTLLQLICGTLSPTSGSIEVNGRVAALLELGAGFNPEFSGRENVYLSASLYGINSKNIDSRFKDIIAFADIGDFIDQPVKTYSSGMFLRLAFAVIAHVDADILIIDEALAVGDAFFIQKCMRFLRQFMQQGTLLFVSHDSSAVASLCRRAIWLDQGNIRAIDNSKIVIEQYLAALYESQQDHFNSRLYTTKTNDISQPTSHTKRDQRIDFVNCSNLRNDLEIFSFAPESTSFGSKGAIIKNVRLTDTSGNQLAWAVGGEEVSIEIEIYAQQFISGAIVGFYINDRLGQALFGDNTYLNYLDDPFCAPEGTRFVATFQFSMPVLPRGKYTLTVAIAEGTQNDHIQHHWIHDALMIESHSSSASTGLVGIPMHKITINSLD